MRRDGGRGGRRTRAGDGSRGDPRPADGRARSLDSQTTAVPTGHLRERHPSGRRGSRSTRWTSSRFETVTVRPRLLALLRCPRCRGKLAAATFVQSPNDEAVVEGVLTCRCGERYPIVDTIPRMLPNAFAMFPEFTDRYRERLGDVPGAASRLARGKFERQLDRTRESFGYQWTTFSEMVCDFQDNF